MGSTGSRAKVAFEAGSASFAGAHFTEEKFARDPNLQSGTDGEGPSQPSQRVKQPADGASVRKRRRNDGSPASKCNPEEAVTPLHHSSATPPAGRTPLADRSLRSAGPQSPVPPSSPRGALPGSGFFQTPVELLSRLSPRRLLAYSVTPPQQEGYCAASSSSISNVAAGLFGTAG